LQSLHNYSGPSKCYSANSAYRNFWNLPKTKVPTAPMAHTSARP